MKALPKADLRFRKYRLYRWYYWAKCFARGVA